MNSTTRITVTDKTYHQVVGDQPVVFETRFCRDVKSEEQPYCRKIKVGVEAKSIELGWIDEVGMLLLRNEEGVFTTVPTDEEKERMADKIVVMSVSGIDFCKLYPGESLRITPIGISAWTVRCLSSDGARCSLTVIPA